MEGKLGSEPVIALGETCKRYQFNIACSFVAYNMYDLYTKCFCFGAGLRTIISRARKFKFPLKSINVGRCRAQISDATNEYSTKANSHTPLGLIKGCEISDNDHFKICVGSAAACRVICSTFPSPFIYSYIFGDIFLNHCSHSITCKLINRK